jgi:hypothetical protein
MSHPVRSLVKEFRLSLSQSLSQSLGKDPQPLPGEENHLVSLAQAETGEVRYDLPPGWPRQSWQQGISNRLEALDSARDWLR